MNDQLTKLQNDVAELMELFLMHKHLGSDMTQKLQSGSTTGITTGFTAGGGTAVTDSSTFTGGIGTTAYRISDIVRNLKNLGVIAS